jgi:hypothetical protein
MPVSIRGSGGGSVTLTSGAASADTTLTLPNVTGTVLAPASGVLPAANGGTGVSSTGAAGNVLFTTDGSTWSSTAKIVQGTAVASTSGTAIDFTSIPSWVKRVTVLFNGVSTNGTANIQLQIGSTTIVTTGYNSINTITSTSSASTTSTTGFLINTFEAAATLFYGNAVLTNISGNNWIMAGQTYMSANSSSVPSTCISTGQLTLSGVLDRVRITAGGTDTFDAGTINLLWE